MARVIITLAVLAMLGLHVAQSLKIAAFNIQVFGQSKMSKPDVVDVLLKIIQRYDLILIQEIRDSSGTAIIDLLDQLNSQSGNVYKIELSGRLGRTSSKEQYAYFYRLDRGIHVIDTYQDPDVQDVFEREPFNVQFESRDTGAIKSFSLIGIHAAPDQAAEEIDALVDVYNHVVDHWEDENVLILGDLNADCSYFSNKKKEASQLRKPPFVWLIPDDADTTVSATDCAYDRFVTGSNQFLAGIVPESASVFNYEEEYGLDPDLAKAVSDHYPIELELSIDTPHVSKQTSDEDLDLLVQNMDELFIDDADHVEL